jgi:hypothetical protein
MNPGESRPLPERGVRLRQGLLLALGIVGVAFLFVVIQAENAAIAQSHAAMASPAAAAGKPR